MTFRLRKSRRITARNGATANSLRAFLALTLGTCVAASGLAAESGSRTANSALRWKPRTASTQSGAHTEPRVIVDHEVIQTQATGNPLNDPFGDNKLPSTTTPPSTSAPSTSAPSTITPAPMPPRALSQPLTPPSLTQPPSPTDLPNLPSIPPSNSQALNSSGYADEPCPKPSDLKPIGELTNKISASKGDLPQECLIDDRVEPSMNRDWGCTTYTWKASGLCHKPLYFEEEALERYGHSTGPISQPFVSAAHFFLTVPVLPYKMGVELPWECKYALGYYRPGSCAPYIVPPVPVSPQGIVNQAAFTAGLIYALP